METHMIAPGEIILIQGTSKKPYELKNIDGVYSCTCPAWRNQSLAIDKRTCKHLKAQLGDDHERIRCGTLRPDEKAKLNGPPVMLAHPYTPDYDITGWVYSEKLDGVRAYWNGREFISRQGNVYRAPEWFKEGLPPHTLDGELWMGRQKFQETIGVVKRHAADEEWRQIQYVVFDSPDRPGIFLDRLAAARTQITHAPHARILEHVAVGHRDYMKEKLTEITAAGAEGLMLRNPYSEYEKGRSHNLLKMKPFKDAEAVVVGHTKGKGRHKGRMGALTVRMLDDKEFDIGTGFTDKDRDNPPPIGTVVTYSYTELTKDGIPKCAAFVRIAE